MSVMAINKIQNKIQVGILGATGVVGQKFVELLHNHPWFEISSLAASDRSSGKKYGKTVQWRMPSPLDPRIADLRIEECTPSLKNTVVFSALDSSVAGEIEQHFASNGYIVISNARNHRMDPLVPLVIPEVNSDHLEIVKLQPYKDGMIVTNPNCSVIGFAAALKPLIDNFGIKKAHVVTLQAISGAGYPGISGFDILDNVIPFISGEEEKVQTEPLKILGSFDGKKICPYPIEISAQCNRIPVMDGHMACVSIEFLAKPNPEEIIRSWKQFNAAPQLAHLPSAPKVPLCYFHEEKYPQPKIHRHLEKGMSISIGRLRECPILDYKYVILSHNTVRGAAGGAILNAEMMVHRGLISY